MSAMALTPEELAAAKRYMRVDTDADDALVTQCVLAARDYLSKAGVTIPEEGKPRRALYDMACHAIALSTYDQRELTVAGTLTENPSLRRIINQLKLTEVG